MSPFPLYQTSRLSFLCQRSIFGGACDCSILRTFLTGYAIHGREHDQNVVSCWTFSRASVSEQGLRRQSIQNSHNIKTLGTTPYSPEAQMRAKAWSERPDVSKPPGNLVLGSKALEIPERIWVRRRTGFPDHLPVGSITGPRSGARWVAECRVRRQLNHYRYPTNTPSRFYVVTAPASPRLEWPQPAISALS